MRNHSLRSRAIRAIAAAGTLSVLAALSACADAYPAGPGADMLVVHGMLVVGAPVQEVLVESARPIEDGILRGPTGLAAAEVVVERADGALHAFEPVPDSAGFYRAAFVPAPDEVYMLRVVAPDGRVVRARTRTPAPPRLVVPAGDTIVDGPASIPLVWRRASGAGYVVAYTLLTGPAPSYLVANLLYAYTDVGSDTVGAAVVGSPLSYPAGARLSIANVDSAYARYVDPLPRETTPRSASRSTVQGGIGLFGSVAFSEERRVEVAQP